MRFAKTHSTDQKGHPEGKSQSYRANRRSQPGRRRPRLSCRHPPADRDRRAHDTTGFLTENAIDRYSVGPSHPPLTKRADGSVVIAIQHDQPAETDVNWLPAPATGFRLNLRLYGPSKAALNGTWQPPAVERLP